MTVRQPPKCLKVLTNRNQFNFVQSSCQEGNCFCRLLSSLTQTLNFLKVSLFYQTDTALLTSLLMNTVLINNARPKLSSFLLLCCFSSLDHTCSLASDHSLYIFLFAHVFVKDAYDSVSYSVYRLSVRKVLWEGNCLKPQGCDCRQRGGSITAK